MFKKFFSPKEENSSTLLRLNENFNDGDDFDEEEEERKENGDKQILCDDVIEIIYSFIEPKFTSRISHVSKQWRDVYINPRIWKRRLLNLFPEAKRIPSKHKSLNNDFYRICYLYVTKSSWEWDASEIEDEVVEISHEIAKTKPECPPRRNVTIFCKSKYIPQPNLNLENVKKRQDKKIRCTIIEIEVMEANNGNCCLGVSNENFGFGRFCGFGNYIKDPISKVTGGISYSYSSNGMVRKNGVDDRRARNKRKEKFGKGDRISMIWVHNSLSHEFRFYKNGVYVGTTGEAFEINTQFLRVTATLYKALGSDSNVFKIQSEGLRIPFWNVIFPLILSDLGKKYLTRKKFC